MSPAPAATRSSVVTSAAAGVPPYSSVAQQVSLLVGLDLVQREDVGRVRDPAHLDDLDLDGPAVLGALQPGDALGALSGQLEELGGCLGRHLTGARGWACLGLGGTAPVVRAALRGALRGAVRAAALAAPTL